ncbi:MAG: PQQ-binding-like beta-propeller repeat protein [Deltaproteobacteria bacterium]|nr:PQQ-binding-like beta-propeller repeat protein [Deltaproteobacteria bacterium]
MSQSIRTFLLCLMLIFSASSCSSIFPKLEKSVSGNSPKKALVFSVVKSQASILTKLHPPVERATPLIIGDVIYQGSVHGKFFALQKKSGHVIWAKEIKGGVEGGAAYFDRRIYFGANDGFFYCLDSETGKTLWTYHAKTEILSTPIIVGGIVYFSTIQNTLYALKAQTGGWVWYYNKGYIQKISVRGSSSPVYQDGKIFVGFSDGYFYSFNAFNGNVLWFKKLTEEGKFIDVDVTPLVSSKDVIVATYDGNVVALQLTSGNVKWKYKNWDISGFTADEKAVYLTSSSGVVFCLNRNTGAKLWDTQLSGVPTLPIVVEDQLIFGSSENFVYSLSIENGSEIWRYNTDSGMTAYPVFASDKLYIFTNLSVLHVVDPFYLIPSR